MNELPLVSISTCSYNNANYVIETLDSIKNQTYPNIELIIVDDCSTDNSVALIDEWLKTYTGRYKFIKHETNLGGSKPYNIGLNNSTGKYYSTVDSDDVLLPEKIATQVELLEKTDDKIAGVYSDAYVMDVAGNLLEGLFINRHRQFTEIPSGNIYDILLQGNYIPIMSMLIKRSVLDEIGGYDESLVYGDYDLWLRITKKYQVLFSDYVSAEYRIRPGSLTHTIKNWKLSDAKIFLKHIGAPLPIERIRKNISQMAYLTDDADTMPYVKELATKTGDRYVLTAWLLWHFKFPATTGTQMLNSVEAGLASGQLPKRIITADNSNFNLFMNYLVPVMSPELLKRVAYDAYAANNVAIMQIIRKLAKNRKDKYLKSICLLWKYKIRADIGEIISARVDGYSIAGKGSLYIDLCMYKDIREARKRYN